MKLIISALFLFAFYAHANAPQKYSNCKTKIREPQLSQGYFMDESCQTAYVKPPINGRLELAGYVPAMGFDDCKLNMSLIGLMKRISNHHNTLKEDLDEKSQEIQRQKKILSRTKRECEYKQKESPDEVGECNQRLESQKSAITSLEQELKEAQDKLIASETELLKLYDDRMENLLKKPGGQIMVGFYSDHQNLVKEFKRMNSSSTIEFRALPIQDAFIHSLEVKNGYKTGFPVQLRSEIFGLVTEAIDPGANSEKPANPSGIRFGEAAAGTIVINKYAACSMVSNLSNRDQKSILREIANTLKPTITFGYQVQAKRDIHIKYEESHLYQLIKKSTSKRRLFRSSSSVSITEKTEAEKWIDIKISSEDERIKFEDSEKLMLDLRREFLDSALRKVATGYIKSEEEANLVDPGPDGASIAAKELRQNCPNFYCQVAAIALNIGSGLFGGSTAEANMKRTVSLKEAHHLVERIAVREYGQQTLKVVQGR